MFFFSISSSRLFDWVVSFLHPNHWRNLSFCISFSLNLYTFFTMALWDVKIILHTIFQQKMFVISFIHFSILSLPWNRLCYNLPWNKLCDSMYDRICSHSQDASNIYYIMTKKFGQVLDVWIKAGIFFFRNKKFDEARKYMDRALIALEKKYRKSDYCVFSSLHVEEGNGLILLRKAKLCS